MRGACATTVLGLLGLEHHSGWSFPQLFSREEHGVGRDVTVRGWASYRPVAVSFGEDRACYLPGIDRIQLSDLASFHSLAAFWATWAQG